MNSKQKKTKFVHLAIQIATIKHFYKSKESIYLSFLAFVFIFSAYTHLFYYGKSDLRGDFFNFPWMSSFLFALSLPLTILSSSLIFSSYGRRNNEPFLKLLSLLGLVSGSFYLAWTFWTTPNDFKELSLSLYLTILISLSIGFLFLFKLIDKYAYDTEKEFRLQIDKLRIIIKNLVNFILDKEDDSKHPNEYANDSIELFEENDVL